MYVKSNIPSVKNDDIYEPTKSEYKYLFKYHNHQITKCYNFISAKHKKDYKTNALTYFRKEQESENIKFNIKLEMKYICDFVQGIRNQVTIL